MPEIPLVCASYTPGQSRWSAGTVILRGITYPITVGYGIDGYRASAPHAAGETYTWRGDTPHGAVNRLIAGLKERAGL